MEQQSAVEVGQGYSCKASMYARWDDDSCSDIYVLAAGRISRMCDVLEKRSDVASMSVAGAPPRLGCSVSEGLRRER